MLQVEMALSTIETDFPGLDYRHTSSREQINESWKMMPGL